MAEIQTDRIETGEERNEDTFERAATERKEEHGNKTKAHVVD